MDVLPRLLFIVRTISFIAVCYVGLYIAVAGLVRRPDSKMLHFFALVASPLLRPGRALAGAGASDRRVRWTAFALAVAVWIVAVALDLNFGVPTQRLP